jgi:hypothetical protein
MFEKIYRSLVLFLLFVLVLAVGANLYLSFVVNKVATARNLLQTSLCHDAIMNADISSLLSNYEKEVYNNPSVDNIYKQTFKANEYQIMAISAQSSILAACLPSLP